MLAQRKFSVYQIFMIIISCLFIVARLLGMIYISHMSNQPIFGGLLIVFFVQIVFLVILIFIPRKFRVLAIIPLLYLITSTSSELISLIDLTSHIQLPLGYLLENISFRVLSIIIFTIYLILLLPMINYQKKHVIIAGIITILFYNLYIVSVVRSYLGMPDSDSALWFLFSFISLNFFTSISIPVVFTLYILDDYVKENKRILSLTLV